MSELVKRIFERRRVLVPGHFVFRSERHATTYVNKDSLYAIPGDVRTITRIMAETMIDCELDAVVGAEKGGIVLANRTAEHLSDLWGKEVVSVYAEKDPSSRGRFGFARGYDRYVTGRRIGIAEDTVTEGGTVRSLAELITRVGGTVIAGVAICTRRTIRAEQMGLPFFASLIELDLPDFAPGKDSCPGCARGIPLSTEFGHTKVLVTGYEKGGV